MKRLFTTMICFAPFCFSSCKIAFAIAASHPVKKTVEQYRFDNYKLKLVAKQDWVGPWYYGYELKRKCCGIWLPKKYYWCHRDSVKNCLVRFENRSLILDKCNKKIVQR